ncbi:toxin YdaT family protein [Dickeya fangzhongdai]|uniref:tRNA-(Guanine-N1)-methyltransferase n=1 Tax=Dickeya fangzhongdai TaxID=1778540 RepID=A0A2K8QPC6_9GAMM|nr:toxin YdaT family protein [Dickeya fangzhongdai]ATZ95326.1 tRNA-(guanine-N1)-methyltransferase [Dickeya fangzhongdai]QOH48768.1 tRNA-(guanine-N1)-methyltransferase [Dickeya fangzhongdai]QOH53072.1 tRNA-(guanine-N1)-methyltransferase [Dickeya fangzhongdai]GGC04534.1 hypothetical protein GCM10007171_22050 [Dickeya fangzhongdai]
MDIRELKREVEGWAAEMGQESVAIEISRALTETGGHPDIKLHDIECGDVWRAINNNRQQIFRWLRSDTRAADRKIQALAPAIKRALPAERRARLESSAMYLVAIAIREFFEAVIAILLGDCDMSQRLATANAAIAAVAPVLQQRLTTV